MIKIAILGYGTVGSGVYEILRKNPSSIEKKAGSQIEIKYILDIRDFDDHPEKHLFTKNYDDILNDDEVSIVVEVMGGLNPAYDFTKSALLKGKNVVTSNKELVATHGTELIAIAKEKNVNYFFEASVGGGIPIIRPLNQCLSANEIEGVHGILNGTTNYILTKMFEEGASFENALKEAQNLGYAERNPAADVEGHDACRKTAILASLATGKFVDYNNIPTEGITKISTEDVFFADKIGYVIKLIGSAEVDKDGKVSAIVAPRLVSKESQLSDVNGVFNAILLHGDSLGDVMFYGRGAGKLPTASAVVADIIDAAKHLHTNKWVIWSETDEDIMVNPDECVYRYFVRTSDKTLSDKLNRAEIIGTLENEIFFTTGEMKEKDFMEIASGKCAYIRIL
ncbi:MAG: homoserine dehydrogenase [Clostridia bacterium]|nr:homoserine dehydrogenase [Clostridia bacterium]